MTPKSTKDSLIKPRLIRTKRVSNWHFQACIRAKTRLPSNVIKLQSRMSPF